jgi:hypothetical protein
MKEAPGVGPDDFDYVRREPEEDFDQAGAFAAPGS